MHIVLSRFTQIHSGAFWWILLDLFQKNRQFWQRLSTLWIVEWAYCSSCFWSHRDISANTGPVKGLLPVIGWTHVAVKRIWGFGTFCTVKKYPHLEIEIIEFCIRALRVYLQCSPSRMTMTLLRSTP